jgi:hypothetical protein
MGTLPATPQAGALIQKGYMMHDGARVKLEGSKQNLDGEGWGFFVHLPICWFLTQPQHQLVQ